MHVVIIVTKSGKGNAMVDWKEEIATTLKNEAAKLPPNSRFYPIRKMMTRFNTSQRTIEQVMERDVPTTSPDVMVSDIMPVAAETPYPIAVVDSDGQLKGIVTKASVLSSLI